MTAFLTLIFPDKTSAYSDYFSDEEYRGMSIVPRFEEMPGLNIVKLRAEFARAIEEGVVDLYLANDTHTGFHGYRLAADAVLDAATERGWVEQSDEL